MKKASVLAFMILFAFVSCADDKYPDLDNGLYAEVVTNKGTMIINLFYKEAPATVANFVSLAEGNNPLADSIYKGKPFYDNLTFHRIMKGFIIQGGDPKGNGSGGPGYKFHDEFSPELKHDTIGVLSMANSGYGTNGSQFFITDAPTPHLDGYDAEDNLKNCKNPQIGCHTVFGQLVSGFDVLKKITETEMLDARIGKPKSKITIQSVKIIRKGAEARHFEAPEVFTEEIEKKAQEKEDALAAKQKLKDDQKALFEELRKKADTLESGLALVITENGSDEKPKRSQKVKVNYAGYFSDGELFDSNIQACADEWDIQTRPKENMYVPVEIPYGPEAQMIAGFKEGIQQLNYGDKATLFIPYHLGYGERGYRIIPPRTNLVFEVELLDDREQED
ncbi:peptidylprolyl isomerase [Leeuwenhoekiella sp. W20_SRS_FM14]|uniref:peptidylprolyl isomerase n=1 Tax=Leeuwenhoekiella sp. W20_SRS_FM14 TaxID=3240270 RepID=UPI003F9594EA